MKILVTGATGGLGNLVVGQLMHLGMDVVTTSRKKENEFAPGANHIPYDLTASRAINLFEHFGKPEVVIHLAWDLLNDYRSQLHLTSILEYQKKFVSNLIENGATNFSGIGTCYEYGLQEGILTETLLSSFAVILPHSICTSRLFWRKILKESIKSYQNFTMQDQDFTSSSTDPKN